MAKGVWSQGVIGDGQHIEDWFIQGVIACRAEVLGCARGFPKNVESTGGLCVGFFCFKEKME